MFARMIITERGTHRTSLNMILAGVFGPPLTLYAVRHITELNDATGYVLGAAFCRFCSGLSTLVFSST